MSKEISANFEDSVSRWMQIINKEKNNKAEFFNKSAMVAVRKIFSLIRLYLINGDIIQSTEEPANLNQLIKIINENPKAVENAFYNALKELQEQVLPSSLRVYSSCSRRALNELGMDKNKLKVPCKKKKEVDKKIDYLPPKVKTLPDDDQMKIFFIQRLEAVKKNGRIHSDITIRNMLNYWFRIASLFENTETKSFLEQDFSVQNLVKLVVNPSDHQIIDLYHMFEGYDDEWKDMTMKKLRMAFPKNIKKQISEDELLEDKDKHIQYATQQEIILSVCKNNFEKLLVSLFFSTGLSLNSLRLIKLKDICDETTEPIIIFDYGKTVERGNKVRTFPIIDTIKSLVITWLEEIHMVETEYLFPSSRIASAAMSIMTIQTNFKQIAKRAGYEEPIVFRSL